MDLGGKWVEMGFWKEWMNGVGKEWNEWKETETEQMNELVQKKKNEGLRCVKVCFHDGDIHLWGLK